MQFFLMALVAATSLAWVSSSGLNNIPTTDTAGHRVLVVQDYPTVRAGRPSDNFLGFKAGYDLAADSRRKPRFEWGLDAATEGGRRRVGQPYSFAVASQDVKLARLHGGYAIQCNGNNSAPTPFRLTGAPTGRPVSAASMSSPSTSPSKRG